MAAVSQITEVASAGIVLRPIAPADVEACGRVAFAAHAAVAAAHGWPPEQPSIQFSTGLIGAKLKDANAYGVLAERSGAVVGSIFLNTFPGTPVVAIGPLTVDPAAEGTGIGHLLMKAALDEASRRGIESVRLVQSPSHLRSLALYLKHGFELREPLVLVSDKPEGNPAPGQSSRGADAGLTVRKATSEDITECERLASRILGFARSHELQAAIGQEIAAIALRGGRIAGYAAGIGFRGHAVGEETDAVLALIAAAPSVLGPGFFVPVRNGDLLRRLLARGCCALWPAALMTKGPYQEPAGAFLPSIAF